MSSGITAGFELDRRSHGLRGEMDMSKNRRCLHSRAFSMQPGFRTRSSAALRCRVIRKSRGPLRTSILRSSIAKPFPRRRFAARGFGFDDDQSHGQSWIARSPNSSRRVRAAGRANDDVSHAAPRSRAQRSKLRRDCSRANGRQPIGAEQPYGVRPSRRRMPSICRDS